MTEEDRQEWESIIGRAEESLEEPIGKGGSFRYDTAKVILAADEELRRLRNRCDEYAETVDLLEQKADKLSDRLALSEKVVEAASRLLGCGLDETEYAYVSALKHALRAEVARLREVKFNSGSFGPYIFGMDTADGMETTVVSRMNEDGTITIIDEYRRRAGEGKG